LLFDIHRRDWDAELLDLFAVPRAMLPQVRDSSAVIAETAGHLFARPIPIASIAGDQQAALFGQRCIAPGMVKNTYGTGCFMLMHTGRTPMVSRNRLIATPACSIDGRPQFALEGSVFVAGAAVQWLRDGLRIIRTSDEVERLAAEVEDNGGVYVVPAFAGLGSPHWDAGARGAIVGLTRGATAGHIARATLESIAYQTADVLRAMEDDAPVRLVELRVDGGATRNNLLMQFQADLLGVPVVRPRVQETTALGAAYLAGLAVGYWKSAGDIDGQWQAERTFEPKMSRDQASTLLAGWTKAVGRAKDRSSQ
jgi:glycerol kinase